MILDLKLIVVLRKVSYLVMFGFFKIHQCIELC